jgi:hypothetical protein
MGRSRMSAKPRTAMLRPYSPEQVDRINIAKRATRTHAFSLYNSPVNVRAIRADASRQRYSSPTSFPGRLAWALVLSCLAVLVAILPRACLAQAQQSSSSPHDTYLVPHVLSAKASWDADPSHNPNASANSLENRKRLAEMAIERHKAITTDTEKLLALAGELKDGIDRGNKDMLAMELLRKAEEIAKLAHNVREQMKASAPE